MVNRRRGEIEAVLGGRTCVLCLTLGALAKLEDAFGAEDLAALGRRLSAGKLSTRDVLRIVQAGLHGAGDDMDAGALSVADDLPAALQAATELLVATFGAGEGRGAVDPLRPQG